MSGPSSFSVAFDFCAASRSACRSALPIAGNSRSMMNLRMLALRYCSGAMLWWRHPTVQERGHMPETAIWNFRELAHHELDGFGGIGEGMSIQVAKDGRRILWL